MSMVQCTKKCITRVAFLDVQRTCRHQGFISALWKLVRIEQFNLQMGASMFMWVHLSCPCASVAPPGAVYNCSRLHSCQLILRTCDGQKSTKHTYAEYTREWKVLLCCCNISNLNAMASKCHSPSATHAAYMTRARSKTFLVPLDENEPYKQQQMP